MARSSKDLLPISERPAPPAAATRSQRVGADDSGSGCTRAFTRASWRPDTAPMTGRTATPYPASSTPCTVDRCDTGVLRAGWTRCRTNSSRMIWCAARRRQRYEVFAAELAPRHPAPARGRWSLGLRGGGPVQGSKIMSRPVRQGRWSGRSRRSGLRTADSTSCATSSWTVTTTRGWRSAQRCRPRAARGRQSKTRRRRNVSAPRLCTQPRTFTSWSKPPRRVPHLRRRTRRAGAGPPSAMCDRRAPPRRLLGSESPATAQAATSAGLPPHPTRCAAWATPPRHQVAQGDMRTANHIVQSKQSTCLTDLASLELPPQPQA
jgi:hypothetical protein